MPYFIIELEEKVYANGEPGTVIAKGNPMNKSAHYLVRLEDGDVLWFSRDEVVPASYKEKEDRKKQQGKSDQD